MSGPREAQQMVWPRPGKVLRAVMIGLFAIWLVFALGMNWAGVSGHPFGLLTANTDKILSGEIWRLLTAPLLHHPQMISHILFVELGLFFLAPSLEESWGPQRFARFLALSAALSFLVQATFAWALPPQFSVRIAPPEAFGAMPLVEAIAIAWACSFKGRTVRLMMVLPVTSKQLIYIVVGVSLLSLIATEMPPAGHAANFAGMGFGWLLGGGTPSPARKFYLKWRLAQLEEETKRDSEQRKRRVKNSGFRVISGGKDDHDPDDKMLH